MLPGFGRALLSVLVGVVGLSLGLLGVVGVWLLAGWVGVVVLFMVLCWVVLSCAIITS